MTAGWQYVGSRSQPQQQTQSFRDVAYQIEPGTSSTEPKPLDVVCLARVAKLNEPNREHGHHSAEHNKPCTPALLYEAELPRCDFRAICIALSSLLLRTPSQWQSHLPECTGAFGGKNCG
jgi:hypothetical protein